MKTIKLLIVLFLFSLQVNATGYSHNMFVAHKKLQAGKEYREVKERVAKQVPAKSVVNKTVIIQSSNTAVLYTKNFANKVSSMVTLNERMLEEGPAAFFESEEDEKSNNSIATKLAGLIKQVIYAFVGSSSLSKS
ncbi:hypothetical protein [Dyadobacter sp. CY356]|uniref:hypothetical protein n=1 Tax=Dyadobacter sp. CY356 TaxID=2906442 RepID=UPI001F25A4ED|nr:hypothetical protein [Dyadobacter sp. CY356]MCF0059357.1 hypothetical protein [Dyadobacter sp. CY356]